MFGLHPNTEIGFRTEQSETLFNTLIELQPHSGGAATGGTMQEKVANLMEDIQSDVADATFDMEDLLARIEDEGGRTPFVNVFYQECGYMNKLVMEIKKSLEVLGLGMKGELQMSDAMEALMQALHANHVPATWEKLAFASMRPLGSWMVDLKGRIGQLISWVAELGLPKAVWISGFFNPQSFLTAVMQSQARKNEWALDRVVVMTEVTKKAVSEVDVASKDGSYVHGLSIEGARWDIAGGAISEARMKEMFCRMPVILVRAVQVEKADYKEMYMCPVYKTQMRGPTYVFTANLKSKHDVSDWILGGVALLMDVVV